MKPKLAHEGMLSPYRALDLTDEKGLFCGKLLGDLGADVIKIERPGGDAARNIGPFYHDEIHPEKSLFWFAFNTSKRGITLAIETPEGREILKSLIKDSDMVIESFPPGYLDSLGLGYANLEEINPRLIMISITPFGNTGPYRDYKAPDIVAWAMGGQMYPWGSPDLPPVRISHHSQAYLHAAAEGAVGALIALHHRSMTGEGQHVDVSIQESVERVTYGITAAWDTMKINVQRGGTRSLPNITMKTVWPCKDGYVIYFFFGGLNARRFNLPLVEWMDSEGMATDFLKTFDWESYDLATTSQDVVDGLEAPAGRFFMAHTKSELLEGALKRRLILYPMSTVADIRASVQLASRGFWVEVEHPELGATITYPGSFAKTSETPPGISRRAPLIGEHNEEVIGDLIRSDKKIKKNGESNTYHHNDDKKPPRKTNKKNALEGIKVVDFTQAIAGALATKTLADFGATVIKIEGVSRPDPHRTATYYKDGIPGVNRRGQFNQDATGKLSVALNLRHPQGVDIAKRLIAWADIVVENFAGGTIERMGMGYEEAKRIRPDIIMLSSCMQGQTGPYADHPGFGFHLAALSGYYQITGWPDREPPYLGPYTDFIAPHFNLVAILAALDYRRRTGRGQYIDMSQYENGVHFLSPLILDYEVNKRIADRMGNRHLYAAPHNAYRCRGEDRWCAIAVFTDREWKAFCKVIDNPSWTKDPRFATLKARKENEEELDTQIEEWTLRHSAADVMHMMQEAGIGAGVLQTGEDLLEHDPQLKSRRHFWELDHPEVGTYYAPAPPLRLSKSPYKLRCAPLLGEHNVSVLKEIVHLSDEEIAGLVSEEVVEFP